MRRCRIQSLDAAVGSLGERPLRGCRIVGGSALEDLLARLPQVAPDFVAVGLVPVREGEDRDIERDSDS